MPKKKRATSPLSERAYEYVLGKLLSHEFQPGEILNRRSIAAEMKISIAPVLEALVRLEVEGLLTTIPRKGTQVRVIRIEDVADEMVVREALECQAARFYCGAPVIENEERLRKLGEVVDRCTGTTLEVWKTEIDFHRALVELSQCRSLISAFQQAIHLGTLCAVNVLSDGMMRPADNHRSLVDKLKTTDPDAAEAAIRSHLRTGKRLVFERPGAKEAAPVRELAA